MPENRRSPRRTRARIAAAAACAGVAGAVVVLPATGAQAAQCWYGSCFSYVSGQQYATATGASVEMYQADPSGVESTGHSLQELSLQSTDSTTTADTVEIGWSVDPGTFGDYRPHLFVYHWIDGQGQCYDGCGFVQVSSSVRPGMAVTPGASADFAWMYSEGDWWAYYDGVAFGYFPGSIWGGAFTSAVNIQAFGEVAAPSLPGCTQMGDGVLGSSSGSSWISGFQLYGSSSEPRFTVSATDPGDYDADSVTATSFDLGGPGGC